MRTLRWILVGVLVVLALSAGGFVVWASGASQPMPEALAALQSDAQVKVETGAWIVFRPTMTEPTTGLIFYPGGKVDARAYAPAARAIAAQGYLVVITPMPLNLAIFGVDQAADVIRAFPSVQRWAIGGHSLGGSMAATRSTIRARCFRRTRRGSRSRAAIMPSSAGMACSPATARRPSAALASKIKSSNPR